MKFPYALIVTASIVEAQNYLHMPVPLEINYIEDFYSPRQYFRPPVLSNKLHSHTSQVYYAHDNPSGLPPLQKSFQNTFSNDAKRVGLQDKSYYRPQLKNQPNLEQDKLLFYNRAGFNYLGKQESQENESENAVWQSDHQKSMFEDMLNNEPHYSNVKRPPSSQNEMESFVLSLLSLILNKVDVSNEVTQNILQDEKVLGEILLEMVSEDNMQNAAEVLNKLGLPGVENIPEILMTTDTFSITELLNKTDLSLIVNMLKSLGIDVDSVTSMFSKHSSGENDLQETGKLLYLPLIDVGNVSNVQTLGFVLLMFVLLGSYFNFTQFGAVLPGLSRRSDVHDRPKTYTKYQHQIESPQYVRTKDVTSMADSQVLWLPVWENPSAVKNKLIQYKYPTAKSESGIRNWLFDFTIPTTTPKQKYRLGKIVPKTESQQSSKNYNAGQYPHKHVKMALPYYQQNAHKQRYPHYESQIDESLDAHGGSYLHHEKQVAVPVMPFFPTTDKYIDYKNFKSDEFMKQNNKNPAYKSNYMNLNVQNSWFPEH